MEWFYVFKPARKAYQNVEQAEAMRKAAADREAKMTVAFNARFRIKEDESTCGLGRLRVSVLLHIIDTVH